MRRNFFARLALLVILAAAGPVHAACTVSVNPNVLESTPDGDLNVWTNGVDSTVTHSKTGLTWKQCVEGKSGPTCATGSATSLSWSAALAIAINANSAAFAGYTDWRVPNVKELQSIVESCANNPAINLTKFPATPAVNFWTASSYVAAPKLALYVNFNLGNTSAFAKATSGSVRLVRGGRGIDFFDALGDVAAPALSPVAIGTCTGGSTSISTTLCATSNENATGYWIVLARGDPAPSAAQIKAGLGSSGQPGIASGSGVMTLAVTKNFAIAGLSPGTSYDLYMAAEDASTNANLGTGGFAFPVHFFTDAAGAPIVTTGIATGAGTTGATLKGSVSDNGAATAVTFDFGLTTDYSSVSVPAATGALVAAGAGSTTVELPVTGFTCSTTYHFRVNAINSVGATSGLDQSVATLACVIPAAIGVITPIPASPAFIGGGAGTFIVSAAGGGASTPVTFSSMTLQVCATGGSEGRTVTMLAPGTCTLAADQAGDASYVAAGQRVQSVTIGKATQAITFGPQAGRSFSSASFALSPVATASSALAVTLTSASSSICTISGSTVTIMGVGTCIIAANQTGDANFNAAPQVTQNIVISKAVQTIAFDAQQAQSFGTAPFQISPLGIASSLLAVAYSSLTPTVCTISGATVTIVAGGVCTIAASQAGDAIFAAAAQVSQRITLNPVVPGAPLMGVATAGNTQAVVSFTAPLSNGGGAITGYRVTSSPAGGTDSNAGSTGLSHLVTGLANGTAYTFSVAAANAAGTGPSSAASSSVTPVGAPICSLAASYTSITLGGFSVLTATCSPAASTYAWVNTGFTSTATGGTVSPAATATYSVTGSNSSGTGNSTSVTVTVTGSVSTGTRMINMSTRGAVLTGDNVMISGFVISGSSPQTVLIRGLGPTLASYGISGVLANPTLQLYSGQTLIASNDDWGSAANAIAIQATGKAPASPLESVIFTTLEPGAYTIVMSGSGGGSGVGIVEVYVQ